MKSAIKTSIVTQPSQVAGVQPQPYRFLLNQSLVIQNKTLASAFRLGFLASFALGLHLGAMLAGVEVHWLVSGTKKSAQRALPIRRRPTALRA